MQQIGLVGALFACLIQTAFAEDRFSRQVNFDIAAQSVEAALLEFSKQADVQVMVGTLSLAGQKTEGVKGRLSVTAALEQLLRNTGLEYQAQGNTITVRAIRNARADAVGMPLVDRLRLASSDAGGEAAASNLPTRASTGETADAAEGARAAQLEEIMVTGTHLRGTLSSSPLLQYDREAIEKTGYTNIEELIRSIPQNFAGGALGASPDGTLGPGVGAQRNNEAASGVNLRGLGENSTLVLLNGQRMAPSAFGSFVDISSIPLAAIDHVDVLTDGSSAVYGSDAVAGVVNFVLRRDYDGAETSLRYGEVTSGSANETVAGQSIGKTWDGGGLFASGQYSYASALPSTDRSLTATAPQPTDILPRTKKYSGIFRVHQRAFSSLELFADALLGRSDVYRRTTLGPTASTTTDSRNDMNNFHGGLAVTPIGDWRLEASGTTGRQKLETVFPSITPLPPGYTPGTLAGTNDAKVTSGDFKADGTFFGLPGGAVKAAVGGSYRKEEFEAVITRLPPAAGTRKVDRDVRAAFAEANIPIVGKSNAIPAIQRLTVSAAVRYDNYSDFGSTTNPKYGILWSPVADLDVRASWSTSFRAPGIHELISQSAGLFVYNWLFASPTGVPDSTPVFVLFGNNPELKPEESTNWSIGLDYQSKRLPGAKFSLNYFDIDFRNRIITPPFDPGALQRQDIYGSLLTPLSDDAAAAAYLQSIVSSGATFVDLFGFGSSGVRYVYADQQQNAAVVKQSGFDFLAEYSFKVGSNSLDARLNAAVINEIETALTSSSTPTDLVDTYSNPLRFRLRADLSWAREGFWVNGAVNYNNAYEDTTATPRANVPSWTTVDLAMRYTPKAKGTALSGVSFGLSAINIFDNDPPFVQGGIGLTGVHYDVGNANPRGRFISLDVRKAW
jgi:iron complex outermembrane recepter protein